MTTFSKNTIQDILLTRDEEQICRAFKEIKSSFAFLIGQGMGVIERIPEINLASIGFYDIRERWSSLDQRCLKKMKAKENIRGELLSGEDVPCLDWLIRLRGHLNTIQRLLIGMN